MAKKKSKQTSKTPAAGMHRMPGGKMMSDAEMRRMMGGKKKKKGY